MPVSGAASSRPIFGRILGDCPVPLWGLTSRQRLQRQLASIGGVHLLHDGAPSPDDSSVVLIRSDYVYEQRTLQDLVATQGVALCANGNGPVRVVAAHVPAARQAEVESLLSADTPPSEVPDLALKNAETLSPGYVQKLLKTERPVVLKITAAQQDLIEQHLFDGSYKGITDLVTKWVWPAPARGFVRLCVRFGIRPNGVTLTSLLLVILALLLFANGWFGLGLILGWFMTFLDTVDGKLARVTIDNSSLGHAMDKGIDLIHPPLWYIAWAIGASGAAHWSEPPEWVVTCSIVILIGYIGGRLLEGAFDFFLGKFPIYSWRPLDAYIRLVIARRNPNLLWLSAFWLLGAPATGVRAVAWWTSVSTIFLVFRLAYAAYARATEGPLHSWLRETDARDPNAPLAARIFSSSAPRLLETLERGG